jgi:protein tyrosine phosphatase
MANKGPRILHPKRVPFEYSQITRHIYVGTNQCCQSHFEKALLTQGIKADISLEAERMDTPFGVDYFLWLPVQDYTPPTSTQLLIGGQTLKHLVDSDVKVYVHCKRGHGRSPTLVAAYFILEGMTAAQAVRTIRDRRPIHLKRSQMAALRDFSGAVARLHS